MAKERPVGRPRRVPVGRQRFILLLSPAVAQQVRDIAAIERRALNTQIEMLLELGLRSYALEASAA